MRIPLAIGAAALSVLGFYFLSGVPETSVDTPTFSEADMAAPEPGEALVDDSTRALLEGVKRTGARLGTDAAKAVDSGVATVSQVATTGRDPYGVISPEKVDPLVARGKVLVDQTVAAALPPRSAPASVPTPHPAVASEDESQDGSSSVNGGPPGLGWYRHGPRPSALPPPSR